MRDLIYQDRTDPYVGAMAYHFATTPQELDQFFRRHWRIVPDPIDAELVRAPAYQARRYWQNGTLEGDCDDAATLGGALMLAYGIPSTLIAIRLPNEPEFSHVFLRAEGVDIDPIVPARLLPLTGIAETMELDL